MEVIAHLFLSCADPRKELSPHISILRLVSSAPRPHVRLWRDLHGQRAERGHCSGGQSPPPRAAPRGSRSGAPGAQGPEAGGLVPWTEPAGSPQTAGRGISCPRRWMGGSALGPHRGCSGRAVLRRATGKTTPAQVSEASAL